MAINYNPTNWIKGAVLNPDNMNHFEQGIKAACDGVDALSSLPSELQRNGYGEQSGGKNLWDERWEVGTYDTENGQKRDFDRYYRCVNRIKIKENTTYYVCKNTIYAFYYDENGNFISYNVASNNVVVSPTNARYMCFVDVEKDHYTNDIAIIEGTNGAYEPYIESNKMLTDDTNEIASLKFLGWTVPREYPGAKNYVDGQGRFHQRVGRKRIGDMGWDYNADSTRFNTNTPVSDYKYTDFNTDKNVFWYGYTQNPAPITGVRVDKTYSFYLTKGLYIHDFAYTDVGSFLSAHGNDYIYYELATEVVIAEGNEHCNVTLLASTADISTSPITYSPKGYKVIAVKMYKNGEPNKSSTVIRVIGTTEQFAMVTLGIFNYGNAYQVKADILITDYSVIAEHVEWSSGWQGGILGCEVYGII